VTVYFVPVGFTPATLAERCADPLAASDRVCRVRGGGRAGARAPRSIPVTRAVVRSLASARSEPFVALSRPTPRAAKYRHLVNCHRNPQGDHAESLQRREAASCRCRTQEFRDSVGVSECRLCSFERASARVLISPDARCGILALAEAVPPCKAASFHGGPAELLRVRGGPASSG